MGLFRRIRRHFRSWQDILLFARISLLISTLAVLMRLFSLPRLLELLTPANRERVDGATGAIDKAVKYSDYLLNQGSWTNYNNCLRRSLVLYRSLRKAGVPVQICFGVRSVEAEAGRCLKGHAWLVHDGEIILEPDRRTADSCTVIYRYPADRGKPFQSPEEFSA